MSNVSLGQGGVKYPEEQSGVKGHEGVKKKGESPKAKNVTSVANAAGAVIQTRARSEAIIPTHTKPTEMIHTRPRGQGVDPRPHHKQGG